MDGQSSLPIAEGCELLRTRDGDRRIARDDLFCQTTHRLQPERQRNHIEQQPIVARRTITRQQIGLHRGTQGDHLVRIEIVQRLPPKEIANSALNLRHARRAADHHDALNLIRRQASITQAFSDGL